MTTTHPAPKISVRGLRKSFGRKQVLDGLDIDCGSGESLVVIGGSGTGKSVLVKCILGLLHPEGGSIRIDGAETVGLPHAARERLLQKFGMLFQGSALFDSLTFGRMSRSVWFRGAAWNEGRPERSRSPSSQPSGSGRKSRCCGQLSFPAECKSG